MYTTKPSQHRLRPAGYPARSFIPEYTLAIGYIVINDTLSNFLQLNP